ncbi:MAG: S-layer homology domain-containing protein [Clostridia bacterium]|nr:S-layer homology domain-containing protein [Clostridia bacterium]
MKKILAVVLAILMVVTFLPAAMAAGWSDSAPTVSLSVSDPDAENIIQATVSVSASKMITAYALTVEYDSDVVDVAADKGTYVDEMSESTIGLTLAGDGLKISDSFQYNVNRAGAASGKKLFYIGDARAAGISKNGFTATMYFKVKDGAEGTAAFALSNDIVGGSKMFEVGNADGETIEFPSSGTTASVSIPVTKLTLSGSVTTPAKGATDASAITETAGNATVAVTWDPALSGGTFAANTAYTATVTVTPATGVTFADTVDVTGLTGYTFTKSGSNYVATKTFPKTADKTATALTITTPPTKTTYGAGDVLDKAGMVATATFDDASTADVTDETTITYASGTAFSKGDTSVTVGYEGLTTTLSGLTVGGKSVTVTVADIPDVEYTGSAIEPAVTVTCTEATLVKDTDYTIAYASNTNVGTATVTVSPITTSDYVFAPVTKTFEITGASLDESKFTVDTADKAYTGSPITTTVTAVGYTEGTDYTVAYSENTNAGTATVTISGNGGFGGTITKNFTITPAVLTMTATAADKAYDGTVAATVTAGALTGIIGTDDVSVAEATAAGSFADANVGTAKAVTLDAGFTLTGAQAANYTLTQPTGLTANITKAAASDETENVSIRYGATQTVDLSAKVKEGSTPGTLTVADADSILSYPPSMTANVLSLTIADDAALEGKTATVTIPVTGTNYDDYNIVVTVTVTAKDAQVIDASDATFTYGDTGKSITASVTTGDGALSYALKSGTAVAVDAATGALTINGAGTAVVTVTAAETTSYAPESKDVNVTINKADITVTAKDRTINRGGIVPDLSAPVEGTDYTVTGLVGTDVLGGTVAMKYQQSGSDVTPVNTAAGTYDIVISGATAPDTTNYNDPTFVNGTFKVNASSGGGGGGGGSSASSDTYYKISTTTPQNGTINVSALTSMAGRTITITAAPAEGYAVENVTVTDKYGNKVSVTATENNKFTFLMAKSDVTVSATFKQSGEVVPPDENKGFTDVNEDDYFYAPVNWAAEKGITSGTSATTFSPTLDCTRGQIVTFLYRAAGQPALSEDAVNPFTDVAENAYYRDAVVWAANMGITTGTTATTFDPDAIISRGQMITFLYRYAGGTNPGTENPFNDVSEGEYYYDAVMWGVANSITTGTTEHTFSPDSPCNRGQTVTFLYRLLGE